LADRIAVMNRGAIRQTGTPDQIYLEPADGFVAAFFGDVNRFCGIVGNGSVETPLGPVGTNGAAAGSEVEVLVRPEALSLADKGAPGTVLAARFLGRGSLIDVRVADGPEGLVRIHMPGRKLPREGETVHIARDDSQTFVFKMTPAK